MPAFDTAEPVQGQAFFSSMKLTALLKEMSRNKEKPKEIRFEHLRETAKPDDGQAFFNSVNLHPSVTGDVHEYNYEVYEALPLQIYLL